MEYSSISATIGIRLLVVLRLRMLATEVSLWLKGLLWLMIDWAISGPGTGVPTKGTPTLSG